MDGSGKMRRAEAQRSGAERLGEAGRPLSRRSARTLYNVADALFPPPPGGGPGGGDVDVAPFIEQRLRHQGVAAARACWALLTAIEWQPVLTGRSRRGFSRLPRERRRALLSLWEHSRLGPRRRAIAELRGQLEEALAAAGVRPSGQSSAA